MLPKKSSLAIITFGVSSFCSCSDEIRATVSPCSGLGFPSARQPRPSPPTRPRPRRLATTPPRFRTTGPNLIDAHGALKAFYQALWRTEARQAGAVTRILHYGDSPVTADSITADVRSLMQQHFGDAGHGFVLIAKPWAWYGHRGVDVHGKGWHIEAASQSRARDGFHGLGRRQLSRRPPAHPPISFSRRSRPMESRVSAAAGRWNRSTCQAGEGIARQVGDRRAGQDNRLSKCCPCPKACATST